MDDANVIRSVEVAIRRQLVPKRMECPKRILPRNLMLVALYVRMTTFVKQSVEICGIPGINKVIRRMFPLNCVQ